MKSWITQIRKKGGRIRGSVTGFINAAITHDYKVTKPAVKKGSAKKTSSRKTDISSAEKHADAARRQKKQARGERQQELLAWLETLAPNYKEKILIEFAATLDNNYLCADYAKLGLEAPLVADRFAKYAEMQGIMTDMEVSS